MSLPSLESLPSLGLDVSKDKLWASLLLDKSRKAKRKTVPNNPAGFKALGEWLAHHKIEKVHACLEATSTYGFPVAHWLHSHGHDVTIANPKQIKAFGESLMIRTKNDGFDGDIIARYCLERNPKLWTPPAPEIEVLQGLSRRMEALDQMRTQEKNRLETASAILKEDILAHIKFIETQQAEILKKIHDHIDQHPHLKDQRDLLTSIPGIGKKTAAILLAEIGDLSLFSSARQLAAYAGLTPSEHSSGTSILKKPRLCKIGNSRLRKALFMPALASIQHNDVIKVFRQRLLDSGKPKIKVVGAIMHKLLRFAFGVLKSALPFDSALHLPILDTPLPQPA
jgi:transposase